MLQASSKEGSGSAANGAGTSSAMAAAAAAQTDKLEKDTQFKLTQLEQRMNDRCDRLTSDLEKKLNKLASDFARGIVEAKASLGDSIKSQVASAAIGLAAKSDAAAAASSAAASTNASSSQLTALATDLEDQKQQIQTLQNQFRHLSSSETENTLLVTNFSKQLEGKISDKHEENSKRIAEVGVKVTEMGSRTLERMREIADRVTDLEGKGGEIERKLRDQEQRQEKGISAINEINNRVSDGEDAVKGLTVSLKTATASLKQLAENTAAAQALSMSKSSSKDTNAAAVQAAANANAAATAANSATSAALNGLENSLKSIQAGLRTLENRILDVERNCSNLKSDVSTVNAKTESISKSSAKAEESASKAAYAAASAATAAKDASFELLKTKSATESKLESQASQPSIASESQPQILQKPEDNVDLLGFSRLMKELKQDLQFDLDLLFEQKLSQEHREETVRLAREAVIREMNSRQEAKDEVKKWMNHADATESDFMAGTHGTDKSSEGNKTAILGAPEMEEIKMKIKAELREEFMKTVGTQASQAQAAAAQAAAVQQPLPQIQTQPQVQPQPSSPIFQPQRPPSPSGPPKVLTKAPAAAKPQSVTVSAASVPPTFVSNPSSSQQCQQPGHQQPQQVQQVPESESSLLSLKDQIIQQIADHEMDFVKRIMNLEESQRNKLSELEEQERERKKELQTQQSQRDGTNFKSTTLSQKDIQDIQQQERDRKLR